MASTMNAHIYNFSAESAGGDQDLHHSDPKTSSLFTVCVQSISDNRQFGSPWPYSPHLLPPPGDPSLPANSRYALLLLSAREGYPLWIPEPNRRLLEECRRDGVQIGDVGIIRPDGFFDYLFNIRFPRDHPMNSGGVPDGFLPIKVNDSDLTEVDPYHDHDGHVAGRFITKRFLNADGFGTSRSDSRAYEFRSSNSEGAILMLPEGSKRVDLENKKLFRQYAKRNVSQWFTYVEDVRGRESKDLSLYIITGCDKASSWGVASFFKPHQEHQVSLVFDINGATGVNTWRTDRHSTTRSGPRPRPGDPVVSHQPPNQCVFLRGFKLHRRQVSKVDRQSHSVQPRVEPFQSGSHTPSFESPSSSIQSPFSASSQNYGSQIHDSGNREIVNGNIAHELSPSPSTPYHPCDTINNFMLDILSRSFTDTSGTFFALSHDDDWRSVFNEADVTFPSEQEMIRRICSKLKFVVDGGTIYPEYLDESMLRNNTSPLYTSPADLTARILVLLTCPIITCQEQFSEQALLLTHMQQRHDVVHGTSARVPMSAAKASSASSATPTSSNQPEKKKRRGGIAALSCAECRRLKLNGCVKKGCAAICPDGSLTTGKGNRFVLANTDILQEKINELSARARLLEEALAKSHSITSPQPHPLLSEDLLRIKLPLDRESPEPPPAPPQLQQEKEEEQDADAMEVFRLSLGSLAIEDGGRSTFFGQTANAWYLLGNEYSTDDDQRPLSSGIPQLSDIPWLSHSFPFTTPVDKSVRGTLIGLLPKSSVARRLCDIYYRHGAWQYTPISEIDFYDYVFRPVYDFDTLDSDPVGSHGLAILFMILALGVLLDLERPSHSPEAKQYYLLGRAALALDPVFENHSLSTIQALVLMCHYMLLDNIQDPRWPTMGLAVKLTQRAGLHRDASAWNLNADETYRRRCLFWETFSYDVLQSFTYGRPPSFSITHIDTKKPHETTKNADGEVEMTYAAWKHGFVSDCLVIVLNKAFSVHPLGHSRVMELDQLIRSYYVPPSLRVPGFGGARDLDVLPPSLELSMERHFVVSLKEITLFYMHRGFFAKAMEENPENPLASKYGSSVTATFNSACICVALMTNLFRLQPGVTQRNWYFFNNLFSCAVVLGSIACKPQLSIAPTALAYLEYGYDLFSSTTEEARKGILVVLKNLKEKARDILTKHLGNPLPGVGAPPLMPVKTEEDDSGVNAVLLMQPQPSSSRVTAPTDPHPESSYAWPPNAPESAYHHTYSSSVPVSSYHNVAPSISLPEAEQSTAYTPEIHQFPIDQSPVHPSHPNLQHLQHHNSSLVSNVPPYTPHGVVAMDSSIAGYQYYDYQASGSEMQPFNEYQPGYDSSGDFIMPMQDDSWQNFMAQYR